MSYLDAKLGHQVKIIDGECVCDICIDSYLNLYNKILDLQKVLFQWQANLSKAEKDEINRRLKPAEKEKKKSIKAKKPNKK